jgi:hypothetical protein
MTSSHQDVPPRQWFSRLAAFLDRRSAPRLAWLFFGAVLARGRRTVTSWIRAAGLSTQFQPCYTTVAAAGKKAKDIAARLVCEVVRPLVADLQDGRTPGSNTWASHSGSWSTGRTPRPRS